MLQFNLNRLLISLILLGLLIVIALYLHDNIIRPFFGDMLAVIWVYAGLTTFIKLPPKTGCIGVFIFASLIEIAQYCQLLTLLGLSHYKVLRIIFGATFDWMDILAYAAGALTCLAAEYFINRPKAVQSC